MGVFTPIFKEKNKVRTKKLKKAQKIKKKKWIICLTYTPIDDSIAVYYERTKGENDYII